MENVQPAVVAQSLVERRGMINRRAGYISISCVATLLCLAIGCCKPAEVNIDHEAVGKWKTKDGVAVAFYEDGVAAVNGNKVHWRPIDASSVRVEDEKEVGEFVISKKSDGSMAGVFEFGGTQMTQSLFGVDMTYVKVVRK